MKTHLPSATRSLWLALSSALYLALPTAGFASSISEKVVCTTAPRSAWLTEAQARAAFHADSYVLVRFKVSKGNCHEFYAIDTHGAVVEAYQHPITGAAVRTTRIAPSTSIHTTR